MESKALAKDAGDLLIFVGVWGVDFLESAVGGGVKQIAMDVDGFESLFFEGGEQTFAESRSFEDSGVMFAVCIPKRSITKVYVVKEQEQILEDRVEGLKACFFAIGVKLSAQAFDGSAEFAIFFVLFLREGALFGCDIEEIAELGLLFCDGLSKRGDRVVGLWIKGGLGRLWDGGGCGVFVRGSLGGFVEFAAIVTWV